MRGNQAQAALFSSILNSHIVKFSVAKEVQRNTIYSMHKSRLREDGVHIHLGQLVLIGLEPNTYHKQEKGH